MGGVMPGLPILTAAKDPTEPPSVPLEPIEGPQWRRANRNRAWEDYWRAVCETNAGIASVVRGRLRGVKTEEEKLDKEGWPGPVLPEPVAYVAEEAA